MNSNIKKQVLITRPITDANETAALLKNYGIDSLITPLLNINQNFNAKIDLSGVQAVLVTSLHGSRALASALSSREVPVFAVGDSSANISKQNGFSVVFSANGSIKDLTGLIKQKLQPDKGAIVYASGSNVAGNLVGDLTSDGYKIIRITLYEVEQASNLPEEAYSALSSGSISNILFYSPLSASLFSKLVKESKLQNNCHVISAYCLSDNVANALTINFANVFVAPMPNQASLISLFINS
ncbi:MAG: uroporphyrinogen-III synthase [Alphaproteobacteria bacterium]|nr:uroporphyrinogen-III synthase [Alphaproteobacteria bacterium]